MTDAQIAECIAIAKDLQQLSADQRKIIFSLVNSGDTSNPILATWANNLPQLTVIVSLFTILAAIPVRPTA